MPLQRPNLLVVFCDCGMWACAISLILAVAQAQAAETQTCPNVIFILADDKDELREEFGNSSRKSPQFFGEPAGKQIPADSRELRPIPEN